MSASDEERGPDQKMAKLIATGFAARGELIPTSEAEVERAEQELAAEIRAAGATGPGRRHSKGDERRWPSLLAAAAAGALVATTAHHWRSDRMPGPSIAGEPSRSQPVSASTGPHKVQLNENPSSCAECCAGSQCSRAHGELALCPSGRQCVGCSGPALTENSFRVRLGNLVLTPLGAKRRDDAHWAPLELCARAGSSEESCVPAEPEGEPWSKLPLVVSGPELLAGFELRARQKSSTDYLAKWSTPIAVNTEVLCRGIVAKPQLGPGEVLGTASVFLDETHYVESGRAPEVASLRSVPERYALGTLPAAVYETNAAKEGHFAFALGPFDKTTAEQLRARLLGAGGDAKVTLGSDFVGEPLAVH